MYRNTVFCSLTKIIKHIINMFNHMIYDSQSGEMIVSGKDNINIYLKYLPYKVNAHFSGNQVTASCNPHCDKLSYEIKCVNGKFVLNIKWDVSNTRTIKWYVEY